MLLWVIAIYALLCLVGFGLTAHMAIGIAEHINPKSTC